MSVNQNPRIKVPFCAHTILFRRIEAIIRSDPAIKRSFRTIRAWAGDDDDGAGPTPDATPWLRLTPSEGGEAWYGPEGFESPLVVNVEIACGGSVATDAMDLMQVVRRAIYPRDRTEQTAVWSRLVADGHSHTGEPLFNSGGYDVEVDEKGAAMTFGTGKIMLDVILTINA